jgi:hypothetical protein
MKGLGEMKMRAGMMIMALAAAAVATPLAVLADPPAVSAPLMPAPFIGAPTNDNPANGQFGINFDDQGRYLGVGTAPEHLASFDLVPAPARPQAGVIKRPAGEQAAVNAVFVNFRERLRFVSTSDSQTLGVARR